MFIIFPACGFIFVRQIWWRCNRIIIHIGTVNVTWIEMSIAMAKANTLHVCGSIIFTWQIFRFLCSICFYWCTYIWMPMFLHNGFVFSFLRLPMMRGVWCDTHTTLAKYECEKCMNNEKKMREKKAHTVIPSDEMVPFWVAAPLFKMFAKFSEFIVCMPRTKHLLFIFFTFALYSLPLYRRLCSVQCCKSHCSWCYSAAIHLLYRNSFHFYKACAIKIPENKKHLSPQICKRVFPYFNLPSVTIWLCISSIEAFIFIVE